MSRFEYLVTLFDWNSWSIVFDVDPKFVVTADTNDHVGSTVFNSVSEQVLEHVA